jgi:5-methyltetrahydrofolate--homocysteine methyltransferase
LPEPPFWGAKVVTDIPLDVVLQYLSKPELFRLSWGAKNQQGTEWEKTQAEFEARLAQMTKQALQEKTLNPAAVYGYFPCNADGDDLVVWDYKQLPELHEVARFSFPRQNTGEYLCISDYYEPVNGRGVDVVELQAVTVGAEADRKFEALQSTDQYTEAYFFHGLAVQAAEATANYMTNLVRGQLAIGREQGKRYSWGYPACPDLDDHQIVWNLMPQIEKDLGLKLTESFQITPEQSTAAIFAHHPDAKYYSVGNIDRTEQILGEKA